MSSARKEEFKIFMADNLVNGVLMNDVIERLDKLDYFETPASIGHHGNRIGGLFAHSYGVTLQLLELTVKLNLKWDRPESPYIIGMFHDLCKCVSYKRVPNDSESSHDEWIFDKYNLLPGHGDVSVTLAQQVVGPLTDEEVMCIRWHMGAFDDKENWKCYSGAVKLYPNVLYTHTADMIASQICNT